MKDYYIYIMASRKDWTLYVWVTSDLIKRIQEHKEKIDKDCFTAKYDCTKLVYYEIYNDINLAIAREKQLKNWKRERKIELIEKENPIWRDLFVDFVK